MRYLLSPRLTRRAGFVHGLFGSDGLQGISRFFRAIRAIRPLRIINLFDGVKDIFEVVFMAWRDLLKSIVLLLLTYLPFAIWGVNLFAGTACGRHAWPACHGGTSRHAWRRAWGCWAIRPAVLLQRRLDRDRGGVRGNVRQRARHPRASVRSADHGAPWLLRLR